MNIPFVRAIKEFYTPPEGYQFDQAAAKARVKKFVWGVFKMLLDATFLGALLAYFTTSFTVGFFVAVLYLIVRLEVYDHKLTRTWLERQ